MTGTLKQLKRESLKKRRKDNRLILLYKGLKGKARIPTGDLMEDLKILTVFERLFLRKSKFMFKVDRSETAPYINDMFNQRIFDENMPLLRSAISSNFIPPRPKKEIFKQSLIYSGPIQ